MRIWALGIRVRVGGIIRAVEKVKAVLQRAN